MNTMTFRGDARTPPMPFDEAVDSAIAKVNFYRDRMLHARTRREAVEFEQQWREARAALAMLLGAAAELRWM